MNNLDDFSSKINNIEEIIDYTFINKNLLINSFTHPSFNKKHNYERLEFLGDAIINFHTSELLFKTKQHYKPGLLTIKRSQLINNKILSSSIKLLKLNKYILVGKNVNINTKICSDVYESLIAAIFLDSNIKKTYNFFNRTIITNIKSFDKIIDYKGLLISYFHKNQCNDFTFNTKYDDYLDNFVSYLNINKNHLYGFGKNKKVAEMNVSEISIKVLKK